MRTAGSELIVVAHPDDETLWLEPWLDASRTVVIAFPNHPRDAGVTRARTAIRDRFPHGRMVFLPLTSQDVLGQSDWRRRVPTPYGVELSASCPNDVRTAYVANHDRLCALLAPLLAEHKVVYTHNPWGEYGHEEHVQVSRAVLDVGAQVGASVWAWDGLSCKELARTSMRLRADHYEPGMAVLPRVTRPLGLARFQQLRGLYASEGAWTWDADYVPPATMSFVQLMQDGRSLLVPTAPHRTVRDVSIALDHLRHSPRVLGRLLRGGRLRRGPQAGSATTNR